MSRRLQKSTRSGGCFLILFFGAFLTISIVIGGTMVLFPEKASGDIWVGYLVVTLFFIVGLGGVVFGVFQYLGKSVPFSKKVSLENYPGAALPPRIVAIRKSNGYFSLKPKTSHLAQFLILLGMSIFWIIVTGFMAYPKVGEASYDGPPIWFVGIFVIFGVFIVWGAIYNLVRWIAVGEISVDVDRVDVAPGEPIEILVSLPGSYNINKFIMDLACQEKATYRQGTDTKTREEIVRTVPICELTNLTARNSMVLANQTCLIPADAVPGFHSSNNDISWMIQVKMVLDGKPDVDQLYPIRVLSADILKEESRIIVRS